MATRKHDSGALFRKHWGKDDYLKSNDYKTVTDEERAKRHLDASELNEAYYDMITDLYQSGWGNKFHFCGYQEDESWETAQARHDHFLALKLGIQPNWKVVDMGCGIGGPAREIAAFTGCHITGINISPLHVERGTEMNESVGLGEQVKLVNGNFMKMPFEDETFDAAYGIEAICCGPDMLKTYQEAYRVLKPGGKLGTYEWVITPLYDDKNEKHRKARYEIERGGSVPHLRLASEHMNAMREAGFEILFEEDRALAKANPVPWWHSLAALHAPTWRDWWQAFRLRPSYYHFTYSIVKVLYKLGLTHPAQMEALDTVAECTFGCRDGGRLGCFTPMHMMIARKPLKPVEKKTQ
ncbi:hypothetical protein AC579_7059 [Pseudocercospora musae]|uniref:Sterol 24-C-methyltransferase n=1 Tax=Pseudocercospora musae TaxID=113226 RepID=A0A139I1P7_9PEZI|nr:hypothetical protein AC579_7059 [Pseudocercospora musae]